jgi:hypothetical protein
MHGREVAVAILPAGALVLLDTGRSAAPGPPRTCGAVGAEHLGRFLAVGTPAALSAARAVAEGRARALAGDELYRRAAGGLPAGRFADGYLSAAGLRTVLAPRGGLGAMAAALLDRGGLEAIGFAAEASAPGARLTLRELVPGATPAQSPRALLERVPAGVLFAADVGDLGAALDRLGAVLGGVSATEARELGRALPGETVLWLTPHTGTPTLTLVNQGSRAPGAPVRLGGRPLRAAVVAGHVVLSTRASGIAAAQAPGPRLAAGVAYRSVLSGAPARVAALVFLDFSELLRLGEQTGLDANRAYRRVRSDLRKVREVGAVSTGDADQTTVQVELSIP